MTLKLSGSVLTISAPFNPETGEEGRVPEVPKTVLIEKLRQAIDLMNDGGRHWIQDSFVRPVAGGGTGYCSVEAVMSVSERPYLFRPEAQALADALVFELVTTLGQEPRFVYQMESSGGLKWYVDTTPIIMFNDSKGRTWTEVKSLFESTIERLERADD